MMFTSRAPLAAVALTFLAVAHSQALTLKVENTAVTGTGSLRQAIANANALAGDDTIVFDIPGPGPHLITLTSALPNLTSNIEIINDRAGDEPVTVRRSTAEGSPKFSIFKTTAGVTVTLAGLTITNGPGSGAGDDEFAVINTSSQMTVRKCHLKDCQGGVYNNAEAGGTATLNALDSTFTGGLRFLGAGILSFGNGGGVTLIVDRCTFDGNTAAGGAGLFNAGFAIVRNSTFTNNTSNGVQGGAIENRGDPPATTGNLTLRSCTFSGNFASNSGGAVFNSGGIGNFGNNIFKAGGSGGTVDGTAPSGGGSFMSTGGNISSDAAGGPNTTGPGGLLNHSTDRRNTDPLIGPLQDNGGPTFTHALLPGSPAINTADATRTLPRDQRGYVRPDAPDIGAFEFGGTIPATLANISTRVRVETGDNVLIGGFIVTGSQPKRLMARALGPSLAVAGALADPQLAIIDAAGNAVALNDNWQDAPNRQEIIDTTIAPKNDAESAILRSVTPGAYTAIVSGVNDTTGIGLVELYDLDRTVNSKLANISTRGVVQTGDDAMIGGFIVLGEDPQRVIVRAIGPSLPVAGKLENPRLELFDGNGNSLLANDNWKDTQQAEIEATTIPPSNGLESAIVITLPPAAYTAVVRGVNDTTGVALVEAYALQ